MKNRKKNFINIFVLLFLTIFPLAFDNYYFNITVTKYIVFAFLSLSIFFVGLFYSLSANIEQNGTLKISSFSRCLKQLNLSDRLFLLLLMTASFSCLISEWRLPALSGGCGKYIGLIFMLLTGGLYYGITRHMTLNEYVKYSFPIILSLISLMSVIQFCGYDIFGFYKNIANAHMYIATFGHIDVFSAFLSVYLPICLYLFCHTGDGEVLLYGCGCFMGFFAVFSSNSDSSYIGLIISMIILLVLTFFDTDKLKRYAILLFLLSLSAVLWRCLVFVFGAYMREISALTTHCTSVKMILSFLITDSIILSIWFYFHRQKKAPPKWIPYFLSAFFTAALLLLFLLFIWFSVFDTEYNIGEWENYLRFNNHWGSDRGYVWKWLFQFFCFSPFFIKLFGAGPDTTALILYKHFKSEMSDELGVYYASAHNEYLNYLVTIGLLGTLLYIAVLIISVIKCFQKRSTDAFFGATGLAIIAYSGMAAVNISQPITMPFIYLLIAFANLRSLDK